MSTSLATVLSEALDDEYKARATYYQVLRQFGPVRPFTNIVQAEERHVQALLPLFARYGVSVPADRWAGSVAPLGSLLEAAQLGVSAEIENAALYQRLLAATATYPDVQRVLRNLQRASQEHHLPAFQRVVARYSQGRSERYAAPLLPALTPWSSSRGGDAVDSGCGGHRHGAGWGGGGGCGRRGRW